MIDVVSSHVCLQMRSWLRKDDTFTVMNDNKVSVTHRQCRRPAGVRGTRRRGVADVRAIMGASISLTLETV